MSNQRISHLKLSTEVEQMKESLEKNAYYLCIITFYVNFLSSPWIIKPNVISSKAVEIYVCICIVLVPKILIIITSAHF